MRPLRLFLLLAFLFNSKFLMAQEITLAEAREFADKLVAKKILTPKGKEVLLKLIAENKIEVEHRSTVKQISYTSDELSKETILQFCVNAFLSAQAYRLFRGDGSAERKIVAEDSIHGGRTFYSSSFFGANLRADYINSKRSTLGLTRTRTLKDFKEIGLINDRVYTDCKKYLEDGIIQDEPQLAGFMINRSTYYRFYDFNKKEQEEYIEMLVEMGILDKESQKNLLNSYGELELKTIPEMLQFSKRYVLIDLSSYEPKPGIIYPFVFEKIKDLIPGFDYSDIKVALQEKKESDLIRQDIKLSFTVDGLAYHHIFFHDYWREVYDSIHPEIPPSKIDQDFHKGINKWLTDKESPYRLYTVNIPNKSETPYGGEKMGLLLLKENEAEKVSADVYLLSRETFDSQLSRKNIDKLINEYSVQGLFSHLSKEDIDSARQKIASTGIGSLEELLLQFPKTIVLFDWETGNLENPYEDLTKQFVQASRGAIQVSNIVDEYKKGWKKAAKVKYGFTVNNKRYEAMIPFNGDWLAPEFLELFKKGLKENNVDGDIYYCLDNGQESGYIFLSSKQHEFIQKNYPALLKGD